MTRALVGIVAGAAQGLTEDLLGGAVVLPRTGGDPAALAAARPERHVVVLAERRDEAVALRTAAALTDLGRSVAVRLLPHGPAAVLLLGLNSVRLPAEPGLLAAWLDVAAPRTWSGAWTPSVAGLGDPAPSLGQHLRSYAPGGAGFVVTLAGAPEGVPAVARSGALPETPVVRPALFVADDAASSAVSVLRRAAGAGAASLLPFRTDPKARFGDARAVEGVAFPADLASLVPAATARCVVCDALIAADHCPFCHVRPVPHDVLTSGAAL